MTRFELEIDDWETNNARPRLAADATEADVEAAVRALDGARHTTLRLRGSEPYPELWIGGVESHARVSKNVSRLPSQSPTANSSVSHSVGRSGAFGCTIPRASHVS